MTTRDPSQSHIVEQVAKRDYRGKLLSSLPRKTLAGFAAAFIALLLISALSFFVLHTRAEGARRVAETLAITHDLEAFLATLTDAETGQRGFLLTGAESYLTPYQGAVAAFEPQLKELRRSLAARPEQLERLDKVEPQARQKIAEMQEAVALMRSGNSTEAQSLARADRGRALMDSIRAGIGDLKRSEQALFAQRSQDWEQAVAWSSITTWAGSGLLFILLIMAAVVSSRDFREQQVQAWLRMGQAELTTALQGEYSINKIASDAAAFLARYLDAQVGAVYFADGGGQLKRVGGYALTTSNEVEHFADGLTKQAWQENRIIRVDDLPPTYISISSGLGSGSPRYLLLAPTTVDGKANGVVELGSFQPFSEHDEEFLRRLGEPLGNAFRSARYRRELERLLMETQRQTEEMQTQQEELRVSNEELEEQSRVLQQSQVRLENQQVELEQINAQLEEQTQSLSRQRDDLARAQRELERANSYKSEFLANMSHELRTPLNSSLILAKLLVDNREGNLTAEQIKFAQTIYSAGNDLLTLINDILDLSKIEAGKLDVRPENVSLLWLIDDLGNTFQPIAQEKGLTLFASIEEGLIGNIYTDPTRLLQILKNLLSNACKFTDRGSVTLQIRRLPDGRLAFEVKDTGIGIPQDQHEIIFEAFRQADGATNRKHGGTGLGLSISRDLARLLGGELRLESVPGSGSTFTLYLPQRYSGARELPPPSAYRSPPPAPQLAHSSPNMVVSPGSVPDDRAKITSGSRVILMIEDDQKFARILYDLAHELDFQALIAESAEEGVAMAEQYRPSAIILDVGLPDRSGLSVLDSLKHRSSTRHIPVHMVSVSDYTQAALEMGAAGYAIKPVKREDLITAFKRLEAKFTQKVRRVLIVEDDEIHRESTARLLQADEVETVAVATAAEALAQLGSATFDCMVMDLSLPDRTGFDLLDEMSQKEEVAFPPVIVYTGRSLSRDEEQLLRRFSNSIIIKGARSPERLLDEVTLFLHQVESKLPPDRQRMLRDARNREAVFEGRRILVVEDDVRNIFALSSVLEPKGARVEIARNGREAVAHVKEKPGVDLVLMDIMMPEMDGLQATREIRRLPEGSKVPIIAITAKAMADDRENCLVAGANDYIAKPLDVDKLLSLARVWMPK